MAAFKGVDESIRALSQRNLSTVLKTLRDDVRQVEAARLLGCAPSVISDWKDDSLERACQFLAAVGLKVVHRDDRSIPDAEIRAYKTLARKAMDMEHPESGFGGLTP